MKRRLTDPVSLSYIEALTMLEKISFNPKLGREKRTTEIRNDLTLLKHINRKAAVFKTSIPCIAELYKLHQDDEDFELYTRDTCTEFHCLLVDLLGSFKKSISDLSQSAESKNYEDFETHLHTALSTGYALLTMSKGRALQIHLQTIECFLMNIRQSMPVQNVVKKEEGEDEEGKDEEGEEDSEELDEELEAIPQRTEEGPKPLWKIYRDWLQLMVVHFNAVDVLFGYVSGLSFPYESISIKILVPPTINRNLLSLQELLTNNDLSFPKFDLDMPNGPTNEQISTYIMNAKTLLNRAKSLTGDTQNALIKWRDGEYPSAIKQLTRIGEQAGDIVNQAKTALNIIPQIKEDLHSVADGISSLHEEMCTKSDSLRLPFKFSTKFKGQLHCEACLASMLSSITRNLTVGDRSYDEIYREMQVGYPLPKFFWSSYPHFL